MHPTRRTLCRSLLAAPLILPRRSALAGAEPEIGTIEHRVGGRIGVAAGSADRIVLRHRAEERFPMCSTFKVLAVAAVLARVEAGPETHGAMVSYGAGDLLSYAPVTRKALEASRGTGQLSVNDLCAAAVEWSDNTAANLLLARLGGPEGLTAWLRRIGDPTTRLDRNEPALNSARPGDPRDTATPEAMHATLGRILLGSVLTPASRERLEGWMVGGQTGLKRLRAGLPQDWTVGDKTGTGVNGTVNDVAILRPPGRAPVIAAVYITGSPMPAAAIEAAHAEIGRLIAARVTA
ncbi:class A beta-lactamase [Methylobacterium sp. J-026]|uniref:class A beta-lactamase n=1 Tax=Methylobacterium sp. J-026 TaxID=2836624 RepID=UPI001FB8D046|nr:class A beta-lactamase [Methylobacterium sp. J-026]MCJ2132982.1 class A beta-lactamase [Methylobacterium sp. J-026]